MRNLFLLAVLFMTTTAFAQTKLSKEVNCYTTEAALKILFEEFKEKPVWMGKTDEANDNYMLLINPVTQTWTLLQLNRKTSCIVGSGEKFTFKSLKNDGI
jgi:hypothetical protein